MPSRAKPSQASDLKFTFVMSHTLLWVSRQLNITEYSNEDTVRQA
jgi:hypothetical protein